MLHEYNEKWPWRGCQTSIWTCLYGWKGHRRLYRHIHMDGSIWILKQVVYIILLYLLYIYYLSKEIKDLATQSRSSKIQASIVFSCPLWMLDTDHHRGYARGLSNWIKVAMYEITQCSPKAFQKMQKVQPFELTQPAHSKPVAREKYPIASLNVGTCFTIPLDQVKSEMNLRTVVSKRAKELLIKVAVIKHTDEFQCYEIARIA